MPHVLGFKRREKVRNPLSQEPTIRDTKESCSLVCPGTGRPSEYGASSGHFCRQVQDESVKKAGPERLVLILWEVREPWEMTECPLLTVVMLHFHCTGLFLRPGGSIYLNFSAYICFFYCYSVAKLHFTLSNPMNCSTPDFPVLH